MNDTESIPQLARRLADLIEAKTGKTCALAVISSTDEDYARAAPAQILDDAVRVAPGYDIELLNSTTDTGKRMFTLQLTDGEMFEIGDAVVPALNDLLASGDSNNYEAKYGSASNLVSVVRKIWEARSPGNPPDWVTEYEAEVASLRAAKSSDVTAAKAVENLKLNEVRLKPLFKADDDADDDGIRAFDLSNPPAKNS